jgi:class 3 adenylate cyclase/tetratricopeptide (TPR) repeat protein
MALQCTSCQTASPDGAKFCLECGTPFARSCPQCGTPAASGKFCGECGTALAGASPSAAIPRQTAPPSREPVSERRTTTVLFGDLVSFTTLSEARDPEEVRELLSAYFAVARKVVERYGGTIEKFIGDAVMAVWGVPVAHEDDAERAVRAGLDLVAEVDALGASVGIEGLAMRVGVVTGSVAVTLGAVNEGMVAGDAVNTAARVQSAAEPGTVWADGETRSLTAAAITFTDMGSHELKGKAEAVRLFRADAVVAARGGALRIDGLEATFTGREAELRQVKDALHATEADGRARLLLVEGEAGIGKTRLAWEFEKYVDGLSNPFRWHRGRCLSYGEGVAFWAFAEMVRMRIGLLENDSSAQIEEKVSASVAELAADTGEAEWLRSRLMALLGTGHATTSFERTDLFSAWSTFVERVGANAPVVLVFEDMHHADAGLLDFVDYLLESCRTRLFILVLSRPELRERRPTLTTDLRVSVIPLVPLARADMAGLVDHLVQDLPTRARDAITARAEGVPLYAVEMVRSLIDRDAVIARDGRYVFADHDGTLVDLAVLSAPTSLQTLIAARLDALTAAERRVVQDASVLGLAFHQTGLASLSDLPAGEVDLALLGLVRKGIVEPQLDPRSPELGQYRFLQALVREVAYGTLARRDRKARHLAAAAHLSSEGDVAESLSGIIAQHLLDALDASTAQDPDRAAIAERARGLLAAASQRAKDLGSPEEALRCTLAALDLEPSDAEAAQLLLTATRVALQAGEYERCIELAQRAVAAHTALDDRIARCAAHAGWGRALVNLGRAKECVTLLEPVFDSLVEMGESSAVTVEVADAFGAALRDSDREEQAWRVRRTGLRAAESVGDPGLLVNALNALSIQLIDDGSRTAYLALLERCIDIAREHRLPRQLMRSLSNTLCEEYLRDLERARALCAEVVEVSKRAGDVNHTEVALGNCSFTWTLGGDWSTLLDTAEQWLANHPPTPSNAPLALMQNVVRRERDLPLVDIEFPDSDTGIERGPVGLNRAMLSHARGDDASAAALAEQALLDAYGDTAVTDDFEIFWAIGVQLVLQAGDVSAATRLLELPPAVAAPACNPLRRGVHPMLHGLVAAARGDSPEAMLRDAEQHLAVYGAPYLLARTRIALGESLLAQGRDAEATALFDLARPALAELGAVRSMSELAALTSSDQRVPVGVA